MTPIKNHYLQLMKRTLLSISMLATLFLASCSGSNSDEFDDANGDAAARYIRTITTNADGDTNVTTFNYDASGKVINVTDGDGSANMVYENNNLTNIAGDGEAFSISELYQSPYQAYEVGQVLNYDSNGNPTHLRVFVDDYMGGTEEHRAEITYDNKPFFMFHTLKAAGIIDVLDRVELNLSMQSAPAQLVRAKSLLPVNNQTKVVVKNLQGDVVYTAITSYAYNADNYPVSATTVVTEDGDSESATVNFAYRN